MHSPLAITRLGVILAATAVLLACGGGGGGPSASTPSTAGGSSGGSSGGAVAVDACSVEGQKQFAQVTAEREYLWYRELADVNPAGFATVNDYLRALTAPLAPDGRDPGFSFMTTIAEDEAGFTSGAFVGFGFRQALRDGRFFIADAFEGGAAFDGGFRRGMEVIAIDTQEGFGFQSLDELSARNADQFGPSEAGVQRGFRLRDGDTTFEVLITKREVDTTPLAGGAILIPREGNSPIGYFHLRQFTLQANDALAEAVASFATAGVTDLVIDLRYNPGGLLSVLDNLLNLLGGGIANGQVSFRISHNDKNTDKDAQAVFTQRPDGMTPLRIAFIVTEASASASEMLVNGLEPHVEVVLVGEDTSGKAVGQSAIDQVQCGNRLRLVTFEIVNGEGLGGYYNGLADTGRFTLCAAEDDVTRRFDDVQEDSLRVALGWLNAGTCPTPAQVSLDGGAAKSTPARLPSWYRPVGLPDQWSPRWH